MKKDVLKITLFQQVCFVYYIYLDLVLIIIETLNFLLYKGLLPNEKIDLLFSFSFNHIAL